VNYDEPNFDCEKATHAAQQPDAGNVKAASAREQADSPADGARGAGAHQEAGTPEPGLRNGSAATAPAASAAGSFVPGRVVAKMAGECGAGWWG
jgi:hypothetical protein